MQRPILGLTLEDLKVYFRQFKKQKMPDVHAEQVFEWLHKKQVIYLDKMSNVSLTLRQQLRKDFYFDSLDVKAKELSQDGTEKFLFELKDGELVETVFIPTEKRNTLCLSSQVGCKFRCVFCSSGERGFRRNLFCDEIIAQPIFIKMLGRQINNIVFMGMGEPLDNYENVLKAIRLTNNPKGLNIGARKITISTCGLIPQIGRLANEGIQFELSISLHAADNKTRDQLIAVNKRYPLEKLIAAAEKYIKKTNRQITFEYVLIKDINATKQDAVKLSKLLRGMNCKVNIIPYNSIHNAKFKAVSKEEIHFFRQELIKHKINTTLRCLRGHDINAACGELRLNIK